MKQRNELVREIMLALISSGERTQLMDMCASMIDSGELNDLGSQHENIKASEHVAAQMLVDIADGIADAFLKRYEA